MAFQGLTPTRSQPTTAPANSVVAMDLGSNSFHLLRAQRSDNGALATDVALARKVQLGLAMDRDRLQPEAIARGLDCLEAFAPYSVSMPGELVTIVGTQALRQAVNRADFVTPAEDLLGHRIEIISGEREAALAFLGVQSQLTDVARHPLLVVDIGGGSTEVVVGDADGPRMVGSLALGCVSWLRYFAGGRIDAAALDAAAAAARDQFAPVASRYAGQWRLAVGCSGTLLAVADVLQQRGSALAGIDADGLAGLRRALLAFDHIDAVHFQGLAEGRRSIFASGLAIVLGLFAAFGLDHMQVSAAGLREGLACQLLDQLGDPDRL